MTIRFNCKCGKALKVSDEYAGKYAKCPACNNALQIPAPGTPNMLTPTEPKNVSLEQCAECGGKFPRQEMVEHNGTIICSQCFDESLEHVVKIKKVILFTSIMAILAFSICAALVLLSFDFKKIREDKNKIASLAKSDEKSNPQISKSYAEVISSNSVISSDKNIQEENSIDINTESKPSDASKKVNNSALNPIGFAVTRRIPTHRIFGGRGSGDYSETIDPNECFLIVIMSAPLELFMPLNEQNQVMKKEKEIKDEPASSPEQIYIYKPKRFQLILPTGTYQGIRINANIESLSPVISGGFASETKEEYLGKPPLLDKVKTIAVAWIICVEDSNLPKRISIDQGESITVPEQKFNVRTD